MITINDESYGATFNSNGSIVDSVSGAEIVPAQSCYINDNQVEVGDYFEVGDYEFSLNIVDGGFEVTDEDGELFLCFKEYVGGYSVEHSSGKAGDFVDEGESIAYYENPNRTRYVLTNDLTDAMIHVATKEIKKMGKPE